MKASNLIGATLVWLLAASPALADGNEYAGAPFQTIDAQAMIDACWEMTYEERSDIYTAREGILLSALCLEDRIVDQLEALVAPEYLPREEAAKNLEAVRMAYGSLIWKLYNEHKRCPRRSCGMFYQSLHVEAVAEFMESLLRKIVRQRNELQL